MTRPVRWRHATLSWVLAAAALAGCAAGGASTVQRTSLNNFNRTFDTMVAALGDQHLAISQHDRRRGVAVGEDAGVMITATINRQLDGSFQVSFQRSGESAERPALLGEVARAYDERMAKFRVLSFGGGEP